MRIRSTLIVTSSDLSVSTLEVMVPTMIASESESILSGENARSIARAVEGMLRKTNAAITKAKVLVTVLSLDVLM